MGGARKWPENEAKLVASFPGYVGGTRKWPENDAKLKTPMHCVTAV